MKSGSRDCLRHSRWNGRRLGGRRIGRSWRRPERCSCRHLKAVAAAAPPFTELPAHVGSPPAHRAHRKRRLRRGLSRVRSRGSIARSPSSFSPPTAMPMAARLVHHTTKAVYSHAFITANVVTIHGAEQIGDQVGLWMELVRGRTLEQMLSERGRVSARPKPLVSGEISAVRFRPSMPLACFIATSKRTTSCSPMMAGLC